MTLVAAPSENTTALQEWDRFIAGVIDRLGDDSGARKQDRSKRREQEILRAALHIFARDGISRARIGDIASEAGMPISSLYEYFPSKEDLAYAVPAMHMSRFFNEYVAEAAHKSSAFERLRLYLWLTIDFARRNPEWGRMLYLEIWPSVLVSESRVRPAIDDFARVIIQLIREGEANGEWPPGPSPYETATILNGAVNQLIITWLLYRKPRDVMRAGTSLIERVMTLLTPRSAPRTAL